MSSFNYDRYADKLPGFSAFSATLLVQKDLLCIVNELKDSGEAWVVAVSNSRRALVL